MSGVVELDPNTIAVPLQSAAEEWSGTLATGMSVVFLTGLAFVVLRNRWNRPDLDRDHAAHILTQLNSLGGSGGSSVVVRTLTELDGSEVWIRVRGLLEGENTEEITVRSATLEIGRSVVGELRARKPEVSSVPVRAVQEGFATMVLGALAMVPVAAWRSASERGGATIPDLGGFADITITGVTWLATGFPYSEILFAFALTFTILGGRLAWTLWMVPPVVLFTLAATYLALERRVETDRELSGPPIRVWIRRSLFLAAVTWVTGLTLATIARGLAGVAATPYRLAFGILFGAALGSIYAVAYARPTYRPGDGTLRYTAYSLLPDKDWKHGAALGALGVGFVHELAALTAALIVTGLIAGTWIRRTLARWSESAHHDGLDAFGLDIVHSLTVAAAVLTFPLMVGYGAVAFGTGKAFAVAAVVLDAPSATVLAVAVLLAVLAIAVAVAFLSRFRDIRRGLRRALSVQSVRAIMFARGFPILITVITAVFGVAMSLPFLAVVATALAAGLFARFAVAIYHYLSYQYITRDRGDDSAARVVITGRKVRDGDGDAVYIADVNGHRIAHRRTIPLMEQIQRDARSLLTDGKPETGSFARYYYVHGVQRGKVDLDSVADELRGDVRTRFEANVKQTDASREDIHDKLTSEYPDHVVDSVIREQIQAGKVEPREDEYVWLV